VSRLTPEIAAQFAAATLGHLGRQYPYKLDLVLNGPEDAVPPIMLHPIFHGSFDWHSCVHGWWQVMRIAREYPDLPEFAAIRARADEMLVPEKVAGELAFLSRPMATGFERPYGWAWLLALHGELAQHDAPWAAALEPLARAFAERFHSFLPKLTYPLRVGTHFNIAFALILAGDWAERHDPALETLINERARDWFTNDRNCQAWEPGGDEFLSPALCEALLMSRVLGASAFADWFAAFLPRLASGEPAMFFTPATVSDRSDGKIAHLDGLNLSRAWCWRGIARTLGADHPIAEVAEEIAYRHLNASLPHVTGDYMGEHWLASFALLALLG
jgi:Protein of unknown function (DUF2891)